MAAGAYHAGLSAAEREAAQLAWAGGALRVIVATVAFRIAYYVLKLSTRYSPGSTDAISPPLTLALARDGFRWPWAAVIMLGGGVAEM